jgi:hypothetical protein
MTIKGGPNTPNLEFLLKYDFDSFFSRLEWT